MDSRASVPIETEPSASGRSHPLVETWLRAMPRVAQRLAGGGNALDVGCGVGLASLAIARAFPRARAVGFDLDLRAIETAREGARREGLQDRVLFEVADGERLPRAHFDFISTLAVLGGAADPLALLRSIGRGLRVGGTYLLVEGWGAVGCALDEGQARALARAAGFREERPLERAGAAVVLELRV